MKRICAVFDIDDTLYLERDYVRSGFEAAGSWAAKWVDIEDFAERCWRKFETGSRKVIFDEVLRECNRRPTPEMISALVEIYRAHAPSIRLAGDAAEALAEIARSAAVAVVSDGPAACQSRKVEALGLRAIAEPIVLTALFGSDYCKPHPRAFEYVIQRCPADAYVYIADNPMKDFLGPRKLGWQTVRIRRPHGLHYEMDGGEIADCELSDCSRLPAVLARL